MLPDDLDERRLRLLKLVLRGPAVPRRAVAELARTAQWNVPETATVLAVSGGCERSALDGDVLADLTGEPHLLVPGPFTPARRSMVVAALARARGGQLGRAAAGLTVPLENAPDSLRWARQLIKLVESRALEDVPLTLADDHLVTLLLLADPALLDQLAREHLDGMKTFRGEQRRRLFDTLRAWLTTRGTAVEIADELDVHPQTVRYRMRQIDGAIGDRLDDDQARLAIEAALRAARLRRPQDDPE
ncbi:helix-turn-helix domain-containing protein [Actinomadura barringtoniae]|uniref:Helix-turn-helix domain-containing protein n=1 Tax=Actinomadura barringtoniae TaxID=1427535 RepID=A0A939T4C0_9ACTN|nr:helix-turn-helix domain-containing protein [Actinomadura barringtoniae]MBO2447984.1 helix-turn-helix domain-containing protein [Actinomadura barringtoniae]